MLLSYKDLKSLKKILCYGALPVRILIFTFFESPTYALSKNIVFTHGVESWGHFFTIKLWVHKSNVVVKFKHSFLTFDISHSRQSWNNNVSAPNDKKQEEIDYMKMGLVKGLFCTWRLRDSVSHVKGCL